MMGLCYDYMSLWDGEERRLRPRVSGTGGLCLWGVLGGTDSGILLNVHLR